MDKFRGKAQKSCQKKEQLWIRLMEEPQKLSEVEVPSDKIDGRTPKAVRSRSTFGQD